jgi:hypothetical protein
MQREEERRCKRGGDESSCSLGVGEGRREREEWDKRKEKRGGPILSPRQPMSLMKEARLAIETPSSISDIPRKCWKAVNHTELSPNSTNGRLVLERAGRH